MDPLTSDKTPSSDPKLDTLYNRYTIPKLAIGQFVQLIIRKIIKIVATMQMSDFKAKMHQIVCRPRIRPRPRWEAYRAPPDPLDGF